MLEPSIDSCKLLLNLINDILDINSINEGKFNFNYQSFDLSKLIHQVVSLFKIQSEIKNVPITVHYDKNTPRKIVSDANRLQQILINLIGN